MASGIWKLNRGFLDPRVSCGSIFAAQLLAAHRYPRRLRTLRLLVRNAPLATVVVELAIGASMLAGWATAALCGCLAFHLGIALTPAPNGVPTFAVIGASRSFFFLEEAPSPRSVLLVGLAAAGASAIFDVAYSLAVFLGLAGLLLTTTRARRRKQKKFGRPMLT